MDEIKLRQYQEHALELVNQAYWRGSKAPLVCMPTGSGKTLTFAMRILRRSNDRFLWVAHTRELLKQAAKTFRRVGIDDFVVVTETPRRPINARVVICSIDRLRLGEGLLNNPDEIIIDEAHLYPSPQRFATISRFEEARKTGLSATPSRGDMNTLDKIFDCIFHPVLITDLIKSGDLVPVEVFHAKERTRVDWSHTDRNDWAPYVSYREHCKGKRTLIFTNKTSQSKAFLEFLKKEGVPAAEVNATMPKEERDTILAKFEKGALEAIVNVRVLTAGYDLPELQAIMLLSPSLERSTYLQVVGRVMRPAKGKRYGIVCDMTGAFLEHGNPNHDSWYPLFDGEKESPCAMCGTSLEWKQWEVGKKLECKTCQEKKTYGRHCPNCGWHYQKIEEEEKKPRKELTDKEKKAYPQHLAEKITDFISSRAPTMYANHPGIQGRLKDPLERDKVIQWQAENFREGCEDPTDERALKIRQATYFALHSHRLFLERVRKRKYHPMWTELVYLSHYGSWANGNWKNFLPKDE